MTESVPSTSAFYFPLLQVLREHPEGLFWPAAFEIVAARLQLSSEQRAETHTTRGSFVYLDRARGAEQALVHAKYIGRGDDARLVITDGGKALLNEHPMGLDEPVIAQINEQATRGRKEEKENPDNDSSGTRPETLTFAEADFYYSTLRVISEYPEGGTAIEITERVADALELTEAERAAYYVRSKKLAYTFHSSSARSTLKSAGYLVQFRDTSLWAITDEGRELLANYPDGFDEEVKRNIPRRARLLKNEAEQASAEDYTNRSISNEELAGFLKRLSNFSKLAEKDDYVARAYRKADQIVRDCEENVAEIARAGRVREFFGIGEDIETDILEYIETNTSARWERYAGQMPVSLLSLFDIPRVGAATIQQLHNQLDVVDLQGLKQQLHAGHLEDLPGFGPVLLRAIADYFAEQYEQPQEITPPPPPTSLILHGPPGTGKTWSTRRRALELLLPKECAEIGAWSEEERTARFRELQEQGRVEFVTFHQSYGYEEFIEGIRPVLSDDSSGDVRYELHSGAFKRIALRAAAAGISVDSEERVTPIQDILDGRIDAKYAFEFTAETPTYVLIIDEINRGNISKILGELITLLEPDKRLLGVNELRLPLTYSPEHKFAVPPNLHIIGTMNTADRSIALMDAALRRRFKFEEISPDTGVVKRVLTDNDAPSDVVELTCSLLNAINARIRILFDRDHQIGHAYFLNVRSLSDLRGVFSTQVIPLLQEYFYGDWHQLATVLGCPYEANGQIRRRDAVLDGSGRKYQDPIISIRANRSQNILGFTDTMLDASVDFELAEPFRSHDEGNRPNDDTLRRYFLSILTKEDRDALEPTATTASDASGFL